MQLEKTFYGKVYEIMMRDNISETRRLSLINDAIQEESRNLTTHAADRRGAFSALQEEMRLCECGHALHQHQQVWLDNYAIATRKQCNVKDCGCSSFRPPNGS